MKKTIILFVLIFTSAASLRAYSQSVRSDLQNSLIRLHIVANSDSVQDQEIKLMVRDACLNEIRERIKQGDEKIYNDIKSGGIASLTETANRVLSEKNADYSAKAVFGRMYFPKKEYKNMTLPSGEYEGVKIILGNGGGHNWWCVLYPPMCVLDDGGAVMSEDAKKLLRETLRPETYEVITKNSADTVIKFKIVEIMKQLAQK